MPTLNRQEEWPPTFTDELTTLFLHRDEYEQLGKPAQVDITITAVEPEPEPEVVEPQEPVGGADGPQEPETVPSA